MRGSALPTAAFILATTLFCAPPSTVEAATDSQHPLEIRGLFGCAQKASFFGVIDADSMGWDEGLGAVVPERGCWEQTACQKDFYLISDRGAFRFTYIGRTDSESGIFFSISFPRKQAQPIKLRFAAAGDSDAGGPELAVVESTGDETYVKVAAETLDAPSTSALLAKAASAGIEKKLRFFKSVGKPDKGQVADFKTGLDLCAKSSNAELGQKAKAAAQWMAARFPD